MSKPMKRHNALMPLSRDHHYSLLLCWKIREGFKRSILPDRIKRYADWFWKNHLAAHFATEEQHIFPILGANNELAKKALAEHRRLKRLFENTSEHSRTLGLIEEELELHIRFEERILFNEIQQMATPDQIIEIEENNNELEFSDDWEDEFWK